MSKEEQHYSAILSDLYQGTFDDAAWDRGLMGLASLVGGEGPVLMSVKPQTQQLMRFQCYSYDASVFDNYAKNWLAHDLRIQAAATVPQGTLLTEQMLLGHEWERSEIFNDFMRPNDCPYTLLYFMHKQPERFTGLSIQATLTRGQFDVDDAKLIAPLLPHVKRALEIKDRLEHQEIRVDALRNVADSLSFGIVILDDHYKLLEASSFATTALQTVCRIPPKAGQPLYFPEPVQRELSLLLASSLRQGRLTDGLIHIRREPGRLPLSILVAPAPVLLQSWILAAPKWLLFVFDPEQGLKVSAAMLEKDMCLSPREAQIASLLAAGLALPRIAIRLGISLYTLRTHIKACLHKLGCHTQNELVRRVLASAAAGVSKQHN